MLCTKPSPTIWNCVLSITLRVQIKISYQKYRPHSWTTKHSSIVALTTSGVIYVLQLCAVFGPLQNSFMTWWYQMSHKLSLSVMPNLSVMPFLSVISVLSVMPILSLMQILSVIPIWSVLPNLSIMPFLSNKKCFKLCHFCPLGHFYQLC